MIKWIGGSRTADGKTVGVGVGFTTDDAPTMDASLSVHSHLLLTDPATHKKHMVEFTGESTDSSEVTGWAKWIDCE